MVGCILVVLVIGGIILAINKKEEILKFINNLSK